MSAIYLAVNGQNQPAKADSATMPVSRGENEHSIIVIDLTAKSDSTKVAAPDKTKIEPTDSVMEPGNVPTISNRKRPISLDRSSDEIQEEFEKKAREIQRLEDSLGLPKSNHETSTSEKKPSFPSNRVMSSTQDTDTYPGNLEPIGTTLLGDPKYSVNEGKEANLSIIPPGINVEITAKKNAKILIPSDWQIINTKAENVKGLITSSSTNDIYTVRLEDGSTIEYKF